MKHLFSIILLFCFLFSSCTTSILKPTIEKIEDVDIIEMTRSKLELNAFMILKNPNGFSLDLAKANMKAYVDDVELAIIDQSFDTSMPANENFRMPITIKMDLDKLYEETPIAAIGKGLQIMSDKKLMVKFVGTIDIGKGMAKVSVPIDQEEMVAF